MKAPCVPNGPGCDKERLPLKYQTIDRKLMRGKCPYPDRWKSSLGKKVVRPPIDAHIYEDDNICHTTCTCGNCSSSGPKPSDASAPPTATLASAPSDSPPQGHDGFEGCEEGNEDDPIDWMVRAELVVYLLLSATPVPQKTSRRRARTLRARARLHR